MSDATYGEIRMFGFGRIPRGWVACDGRLLPIQENTALFSLLGTTYGGDGIKTFAVPDLRGRVPMHWNDKFPRGSNGGEAEHTLTLEELPRHTHAVQAVAPGAPNQPAPAQDLWAAAPGAYAPSATGPMSAAAIQPQGGFQPHENMAPYLTLNLAICVNGAFPTRAY
ncbi:MAG: phage tail protein [Acidobacteria bacterium]|nr:phage tail protein [Acidobacteriota bacterium]MBI3424460.1 phage tail protein [Acidobacteriota bacterium]